MGPPSAVAHSACPRSSWISAITTLAPWWTKSFAVHSPIPLAPPVMIATFPSSLMDYILIRLTIRNRIGI